MALRYGHLDPNATNNYLRNIRYKGVMRAHDWRRTARTQAVDLLGVEKDIIKRQMGWIPENKVEKAYDQSLRLDERRNYLEKWCKLLIENGLEV